MRVDKLECDANLNGNLRSKIDSMQLQRHLDCPEQLGTGHQSPDNQFLQLMEKPQFLAEIIVVSCLTSWCNKGLV